MHRYRSSPGTILVIDGDTDARKLAGSVLRAAGWHVSTAVDGEAAIALLEQFPSLILIDADMTGSSETVAAIRRRDDAVADVAILARTASPHRLAGTLHAHGFDGVIAKPCPPDILTREAALWLPYDAALMLTRLEQALGPDEMRALTARFRMLLARSLGDIESPKVAGAAHRIAGIAGTLGFCAVASAWLALSIGDESAVSAARREARRTIMAIDRHLGCEVHHT